MRTHMRDYVRAFTFGVETGKAIIGLGEFLACLPQLRSLLVALFDSVPSEIEESQRASRLYIALNLIGNLM